jgi:hypothetical protein
MRRSKVKRGRSASHKSNRMKKPGGIYDNMEPEICCKSEAETKQSLLFSNLIVAFRLVHRLYNRSRVLPMNCCTNPNQDCNRWV